MTRIPPAVTIRRHPYLRNTRATATTQMAAARIAAFLLSRRA